MMRRYLRLSIIVLPLIALLCLPFVSSNFIIHIAIWTLWYIMVGVLVNLQVGFSGQLSLLFPAYVGLGAYTSASLNLHFGVSPWLGLIAGGLVAGSYGLFAAWLAFRTDIPPLSFAIFTLVLCMISEYAITLIPGLGGTMGFPIISIGNAPSQFQWIIKAPYYFIILVLTAGVVFLSRQLLKSKVGLYLRAMRDNEQAAASIGVNLLKYKLFINFLCGSLTSLAGVFFVQYVLFVEPRSVFGVILIIEIFLFIAVGGLGTLWGPVVGCAILVPLGELLRAKLSWQFPGLHLAIFGLLLVLVIEFFPNGIVGWFEHRQMEAKAASSGSSEGRVKSPPLIYQYINKLKIRK